MIKEITLPEIATRLQALEDEVKAINAKLNSSPPSVDFEFVIYVDGREIWSGIDVQVRYPEILREYPNAQISIGWRSSSIVLI